MARIPKPGSLFPHLPVHARLPFGVALAVLVAAMAVFALVGWQAALISVGSVGLTLVFSLYLWATGLARALPTRPLLVTAGLAVALGVSWVLLTGDLVADAHDYSIGLGEPSHDLLLLRLGVPVGSALLMLVPGAVALRLAPATPEPLDDYVFGALGAMVFTAAATLTRLAPQYATGIVADDRPTHVLLVQAGIQGVTLPVTAAALGGLMGLALWARRRAVATFVVVVVLWAAMGVAEFLPLPQLVQLATHAVIAAGALIALGVGLRVAEPGHAHPVKSVRKIYAAFIVGLAVVIGLGVTAAALATPRLGRVVCPPDCGRPPIGEPIEINPRFYAEDGAFSVQYPGPGSAYEATMYPDGVELEFTGGDTGTLDLWGLPAEGRTPKQIAEDLIAEYYPDAVTEYEIPNAMVGYEPGYGVVADDYPQDANGSFTRLRLIVMVAVRNDYALVASAVGPYHEFTRDFGTGHPSGANLQLALDMGKYVNSFRWGGVTD
jgi:hypothetical protein